MLAIGRADEVSGAIGQLARSDKFLNDYCQSLGSIVDEPEFLRDDFGLNGTIVWLIDVVKYRGADVTVHR